jgi:hypothetical protein
VVKNKFHGRRWMSHGVGLGVEEVDWLWIKIYSKTLKRLKSQC